MALYDDRKRSFFPNVSFSQPGMREGQARMDQIANTSTYKSRRAAGSTVYSPEKGSMFVPSGQLQGYLSKGYTTATPYQSNYNESYAQGYGAPNPPAPEIVSGAGGNYLSKGGVMNPVENLPANSPYSTFGSRFQNTFAGRALSGIGTFAANLFNQGRTQGAAYMPNYNTTGYSPPSFAGESGGYSRSSPRKYFDL